MMPGSEYPAAVRSSTRYVILNSGLAAMEIKINGEDRTYAGPPILGELLLHLGVNTKSVAVERNFRILARNEIEAEPVEPGDTFEIIRLVGGG